MVRNLNLNKLSARLAFGIFALAVCSVLFVIILASFVIGTVADDRVAATRGLLQVPVEYFPRSGRLNARRAAAELLETDRNLDSAQYYAQRAVNLSPYDHRFRLTLASVQEARGDRAAALNTLQNAVTLAPHYWNVHYRLGNMLVREGKLAESIKHFRISADGNDAILPGALDLVWRATNGDLDAVETMAGTRPRSRLALARFLLNQKRPLEAAGVFGSIDRAARIAAATESSAFLAGLVAS